MPSDPAFPGGYAMDKNHLHIWPRHAFMLIGLPNKVRVFFLSSMPGIQKLILLCLGWFLYPDFIHSIFFSRVTRHT